MSFICTKPWKGASVNFFVWQFSIETFMFNASSSKSISSTRGTVHFTRQPRSCEVAPTLRRQFHSQTLLSNTSDSSSSLFHFRCSSSHPVPNGMKLMAISRICVSAYKYKYSKSSKTGRQVTCSKDCAVDLKERCKLRELPRQVEAA